jgi:hypothetical protein
MSGKLNDVQARNKITQTAFYQAACHSVSQAMPVIDIFAAESAAYANADKVECSLLVPHPTLSHLCVCVCVCVCVCGGTSSRC